MHFWQQGGGVEGGSLMVSWKSMNVEFKHIRHPFHLSLYLSIFPSLLPLSVSLNPPPFRSLTHPFMPLSILSLSLSLSLRLVDLALKTIMRAMWFAGGFHWITVKGRQAPPSEASILTLAPHSSYFDAIPVTMTMASIVMKAESKDIPVWGSESLSSSLHAVRLISAC